MKFNLRSSKFFFVSLALCLASSAGAATVVFNTSSNTGLALDVGRNIAEVPFTVNVSEIPGLQLTIASASSFDISNSTFNGNGTAFGINSPTPVGGSENAAQFDVDASEVLGISFSQDVLISSVDLTSFTGDEEFNFAGINFADGEAPGNTFTFDGGGLAISAGTVFELSAGGPAGSSVGLESITLTVVPEPSSSALLCFSGLGLCLFRRRS